LKKERGGGGGGENKRERYQDALLSVKSEWKKEKT